MKQTFKLDTQAQQKAQQFAGLLFCCLIINNYTNTLSECHHAN